MNKRTDLGPFAHYKEQGNNNEALLDLGSFEKASADHFNKAHSWLLYNGRMAMTKLFEHLKLTREDEVYITTTFDYPNISSCVTCTVFNFCKPSRVFTENTKAIFIIHEFGIPHPKTFELQALAKEKGISLIEDCAHTIDSYFDNRQRVGSVGNWTIVTFPKIFPVNIGGLLLGNTNIEGLVSTAEKNVTGSAGLVQELWETIPDITQKRVDVFKLYARLLENSNYKIAFSNTENVAPWFFPLHAPDPTKTIKALRENNIDCGLWHGTDIVVLPLHQYVSSEEIYYICDLLIKTR